MTKVVSTIDLSEAMGRITKGGARGLRKAVEHWLTEANKHVPHDEGVLERSGTASTDGLRGAVSYDTPYAVRQHEDMTLHHDGKGRAKWLETAGAAEAATMAEIIATEIRAEVGS